MAEPLVWRWSNPGAHGNNIAAMAHRDGWVIQVAERGQIYASRDLDQWTPRVSGTSKALRSVAFFGEKVVITGENGIVLVADSIHPTQPFHKIDLGTADWLEGTAAAPQLLVAVGDNAAIYTSNDALAWQRRPQPFGAWLRSVAYGNGLFVAAGENGFVITSSNGAVWQQQSSGAREHLNHVAWVHDRFWIAGDSGRILSSSNGAVWQTLHSGATNTLFAVTGNPDSLVVAGDTELRLRENNLWSDQIRSASHAFPAPHWTYLSSLWEGSVFLLGGRSGMLVEGFKTNSSSPTVWVERRGSVRNWLWDVTRTPEFYLAVGDRATVMSSENGMDWELEVVPDSLTNAVFLGVGSATNLYVVVGNQGRAMISANGVIWEKVPMPTDNDLQGVAALNGLFVVTGGAGTILTSASGTNWTQQSSPVSAFLSSVAAFPGGFVAVGNLGTILHSADGRSWTARPSGTTNWLYRVRYVGGQFVAVGQGGTILTSLDGLDWSARSSGTTQWLYDVAKVGPAYFIAGNQGTVLQSEDAARWSDLGTITLKSLFGLAGFDGQLIAVGLEGVILRTQVVRDQTPIAIKNFSHRGGQNVFLFTGRADQRFTLDSSVDLPHWEIGTELEFSDSSGTLLHLEAAPHPSDRQFFRATLR